MVNCYFWKNQYRFMKYILASFLSLLVIITKAQTVNYTLEMPAPHTHYFELTMDIKDIKSKYIDVKMPVWAPGSYLIREFAKSVEGVSANTNGKEVKVDKINKNTWRVYSNKAVSVQVKYKVYAYELSVRTSYIDQSHGYLNGTSVFMYVDGKLDIKGELTVVPYKAWKEISTGLPMVAGNKWKRSYSHYDILVDSPIEIGNQEIFEFESAGVKHTVAMYGQGNYDIPTLQRDMAKIVKSCTDVFGFNPNKEYTFIIHNLTKGSGGLEHLNSTTLQVDRWTYEGAKYNGFLSLVAHEYFHLWNVKRIRPIELGPFNYDEENYTSLLWIMEGFTSYYDELLLMRAGFYSPDEYLRKLSGTITRVENQPGNKVLPLSQSSLDAWIKLYRPNENSYNTTISYYSKGSIVAAMLDLNIINATKGEKSLDDVLVYLYKNYHEKQKRGFTEDEAKAALESVGGIEFDAFFDKYINGTETMDYDTYLAYVGVQLEDQNKTVQKPSLGVVSKEEDGKLVVSTVIRNTTAYEGGLNVNDEILAVNGIRMSKKNLDATIDMMNVGDEIEILVARDNLIMTLKMPLKADPSHNFVMKPYKLEGERADLFAKWMSLE